MTIACRPRFYPLLIAAVILPLATANAAAVADPDGLVEKAEMAFRDGDYPDATKFGRSAGTARGSTLAAWAELAQGQFLAPRSERMRDFTSAEQDARQALRLDSHVADGHLALAIALGMIGRQEGSLIAHFAGRAREARQHIDMALALEPGNPWAYALLGGWNLEIIDDGGSLGGQIYGATLSDGITAYTRALALDPDNIQISYQYALELLALDAAKYRDEAKRLLSRIALLPPRNAVESLIHSRALAARDDAKLAQLVDAELGNQ
jgi:tetratricopeptide (TPR) repeat protein